MKRLLALILSLSLMTICLNGCSTAGNAPSPTSSPQSTSGNSVETNQSEATKQQTPTQVPESVVLLNITDANLDWADRYSIFHNYDAESHIDNVTVSLYQDGSYGAFVRSYHSWYQYDKASDVWTLVNEDEEYTKKYSIDENAYTNSDSWEGTEPYPDACNYSIVFYELDTEAYTARIDCMLDFEDSEISDIYETMTVYLDDMAGTSAPFFSIEYEYPGIASTHTEELRFFLTIDGLKCLSDYS